MYAKYLRDSVYSSFSIVLKISTTQKAPSQYGNLAITHIRFQI